jgi:hypothetical protein
MNRGSEPLKESNYLALAGSDVALDAQPSKTLCALPASETGHPHLHVIAQEVSRVAELCIGRDMGYDEHGHAWHSWKWKQAV